MINREMKQVEVLTFNGGKDSYGRPRKSGNISHTADMMVKVYQQRKVDDIRYVDVTHLGLTADKSITDSNQIIIDNDTYEVLYVIPSNRLNQVLMKKV
jgi:hypothetical protein